MSAESDIIGAVNALGTFDKVRYVLADSDNENMPTGLPFFVLGGAQRDFSSVSTFCGTALILNTYDVVIGAATAADIRSLTESVVTALAGIANVTASSDEYDDESGIFICNISLTS